MQIEHVPLLQIAREMYEMPDGGDEAARDLGYQAQGLIPQVAFELGVQVGAFLGAK